MRAFLLVCLVSLAAAQEGRLWRGRTLEEWEQVVAAGRATPTVIRTILEAVACNDPKESAAAIELLGKAGSAARSALPVLYDYIAEKQEDEPYVVAWFRAYLSKRHSPLVSTWITEYLAPPL